MIPTRDRLIKPMIMGKIFFTLDIYCSKVSAFLLTVKPCKFNIHNPGQGRYEDKNFILTQL